jgi:Brp/Blh family beta-carotene 15,15'-monooxygenase
MASPISESLQQSLRTVAFAPGWIGIGVFAAMAPIIPMLPTVVQYVPLAVSIILLGLPHGAVDHLAIARAEGETADLAAIGRVFVLYTFVGILYAINWFLAPAIAFVLFIFVTWVHWGQGDLFSLVGLENADHIRSVPQRVGTILIRGGLPMLVPLVAFPEWYRTVATDIVGLFAPDRVHVLESVFRTDVRITLAIGFGSLILWTLAVGYIRAETARSWRLDTAETVGLGVYFALVPPVLAIGIYFCVWHSLRHIVRLMLLDGDTKVALETGEFRTAFTRFARDATPLTIGALVILGGLSIGVPNPPQTVPEWTGLYLAFIAIVTLPHVIVVTVMDRKQGVWSG